MFKGKYLAEILASYIIVFAVCFYFAFSQGIRLAIALVLLLLLFVSIFLKKRNLLFEKRRIAVFLLALFLVCFSFGYSEHFLASRISPAFACLDGASHTVSAKVREVRYEEPFASEYTVDVIYFDDKALAFGALLEISYMGELRVGDEITFEGIEKEISDEYRYYHKAKGVLLSFEAEKFTVVGGFEENSLLVRIRSAIAKNFDQHIGDSSAGYASALLIGDRSGLDGQTHLAYQRLGISHVLAVSGLHFSVIVGGLDFALRALTLPKKKKNLILILFSLAFAAVCGFSASILRAFIMFCLYYIADSIGEKSDSLTSLCFATALIITVNPWSIYDAGLWLSAFSTLGIVLVMPSLNGIFSPGENDGKAVRLGKRLIRPICRMLVMNLTAIFFTMPIAYFLYGGISLISPLSNLIFIPLTEGILYLLIVLTLIGWVPYLAPMLGKACAFLIEFTDHIADVLSDLRGIYISIRYPFAKYILAALCIGIAAVLLFREFKLRRMLVVYLLVAVSFGVSLEIYSEAGKDSSNLYLQTDGKNDMIGIVDEGNVMLIDVTNGGKRVPKIAVDVLAEYHRCEIDLYVVTHLHSYHANTLRTLADDIKIHRVLLPMVETEEDAAHINAIIQALDGACEVELYKRDGKNIANVGKTAVRLPAYHTIDRSEHPLILFSAETDGVGSWIYCGSSSMEICEYWDDLQDYRAVLFGSHGPIVKNVFDDRGLVSAELVLFTSEDTANLIDAKERNGETEFVEESYHIRFLH